jgi:hypothetical protein
VADISFPHEGHRGHIEDVGGIDIVADADGSVVLLFDFEDPRLPMTVKNPNISAKTMAICPCWVLDAGSLEK